MSARADVSFVVAFRNEEGFLEKCCESLAAQRLGNYSAEILLIDGASNDGSLEIAERFTRQSYDAVCFRVIANPEMRTPFAFNLGIEHATADVIGFGGAHTIYPPDYLRTAVEVLAANDVDVVGGGHNRFLSSTTGPIATAVTFLYQSRMGAGVAPYHRRKTAGVVDTVYGGFYRRKVFERVGGFDNRLTRNQDNELNSRVTRAGFRIYFDPELSTDYVMKSDLRSFFVRAFRFGLYHPRTWRANPSAFKLRHVIPALFVLYLLTFVAVASSHPFVAAIPVCVYLVLLVAAATHVARRSSILPALASVPLFCGFHISYGLGTLTGLCTEPFKRPVSSH